LDTNALTETGQALVDADVFAMYDASQAANRKSLMSRLATYLFGKISGDVTVTSAGVATAKSWSSYTPVMTAAAANPTRGTGGFSIASGRYVQIGKSVYGHAIIICGNTGVAVGSGDYRFSLPVAVRNSGGQILGTLTIDSFNIGVIVGLNDGNARGGLDMAAAVGVRVSSSSYNFINGRQYRINFSYEAA